MSPARALDECVAHMTRPGDQAGASTPPDPPLEVTPPFLPLVRGGWCRGGHRRRLAPLNPPLTKGGVGGVLPRRCKANVWRSGPTRARRGGPHRRRRPVSPPTPRCGHRIGLHLEWLEDRTVLSTFTVNNLADVGPGSLRQAILDSNAATGGTNTIDFQIPGPGVPVIA